MEIETNTYYGLVSSIYFAKNTFDKKIDIKIKDAKKVLGNNPAAKMEEMIFNSIYSFKIPKAQLISTIKSYVYEPKYDTLNSTIKYEYMSSKKEMNDLICIASEIGQLLRKKIKKEDSFFDVMLMYQNFISKYFKYKDDGYNSAHSALSLLKTRKGVCQAIAALTLLVMPYIGYRTIYCIGKGLGRKGWTPHAWNIIETPVGFRHFDFTFGMYSNHPSNNIIERDSFVFNEDHIWDKDMYSDKNILDILNSYNTVEKDDIMLHLNDKSFEFGENNIKMDFPIYKRFGSKGNYINIYEFTRLFGGACEYLRGKNQLRILLFDKEYLIKNAENLIENNEYLNIHAISELPFESIVDNEYIVLKKR